MPKKAIPELRYAYRRINHPQRGGKFHLNFGNYSWGDQRDRMNDVMQNHIVIGRTYTFPYLERDFHNHGGERSLKRWAKGIPGARIIHDKWFVYVRGTYRYGGTRYALDHKRTGIYSNVVKLEFDLELEDD